MYMFDVSYGDKKVGEIHENEGHLCINIMPRFLESGYKISDIRFDADSQHLFVQLTEVR